MRLLLDEDVPVQLVQPLRAVLKGHTVDHVDTLGWKGKKDHQIYRDAAAARYDAIITNDLKQLDDPDETRDIARSGLHHIRYAMTGGRDGLGRAMGAVLAAAGPIVRELDQATGQRLVRIAEISPSGRYATVDPVTEPSAAPYWPRAGSARGRPGKRAS